MSPGEVAGTVGIILVLNRLSGADLGSVFIRRGNLKWALLAGVAVLLNFLSAALMAAALARALGQPVRYNEITPEEYRGFGFPGADDLGNMFQVYRDFETEVCGARNLDVSRSLNPELQTFEQWLARNKGKIPIG